MSHLSPMREGRITSSRIAAIVGLHPYKGPHGVWREMTGRESFDGNRATRRGLKLERPVMEMAAEDLGLAFCQPGFRIHPEHYWAGDSIDFVLINAQNEAVHGAEVKTCAVGVSRRYGETGTDAVPEEVLVQCQWHLTHWPELPDIVCPMLGGFDLDVHLYWVKRDENLIGLLLEEGERFYRNHIKPDVAPDVDAFADTRRWLDSAFPTNAGDVVDATPEMIRLADKRKQISEQLKTLSTEQTEITNNLRELLGTHEQAVGDTVTIKNIYVEPNEFTVKRGGYHRLDVRYRKPKKEQRA